MVKIVYRHHCFSVLALIVAGCAKPTPATLTYSSSTPTASNVSTPTTISTPAEIDTSKINVTIMIDLTGATWREGQNPYDIYKAVKGNLENTGFKVVQKTSTAYDSVLKVNYKETKGEAYEVPGGAVFGYGTNIECKARLEDKLGGTIFETTISGTSPSMITAPIAGANITLYQEAVRDFEDHLYFKYLGDIIAAKYGIGNEISVFIRALKDKSYRAQEEAAQWLGQTADSRAVEPLINALKSEFTHVRGIAAQSLGNIRDLRAVEPLIDTLNSEGDAFVRAKAAEALGIIGDARAVESLIEALVRIQAVEICRIDTTGE